MVGVVRRSQGFTMSGSRKRARLALATTLHHRIELDFFEEWLDYHCALDLDRLFVGVDVRRAVGDGLARRLADTQEETVSPPYVWWKKPNFDYHHELTYEQVLATWREGIDRVGDERVVPFFLRLPEPVHSRRQLHWLSIIYADYADDFDFLFFLDGDEFLVPQRQPLLAPVIDALDESVALHGLRQKLFDQRWSEPGVNRRSVLEITRTQGLTAFDNPPPAHAFKCLFGPRYPELERADLHPHSFVRDLPEAYGGPVPDDLLQVHHFRGWQDVSHRPVRRPPAADTVDEDHRHQDVYLANATVPGHQRYGAPAPVLELVK
jgi:hypothetical protein